MNKFLLSTVALCIAAALFLSACQDTISPNLEDSLDLFAGLEAITEAQQTNVTINKGTAATDGYFTIQIDNIDDTPLLAPGVHEAWCLEWNKNLRSNGDVHQGVKWFSTGDNDTWKPLNYLFSIRGELQASDPDLTFRDLQAVVWVLAGEMGIAPAFDVLNLPAERIPARLRAGDELAIDREKVASIARRVMSEAPEAIGIPVGTVAQTAEDEQDIYTPPISPTDVLAVSTVPMVNSCPPNGTGRICETLVGNAITDAYRFTHNVDFGFINSGAIRADLTCSQQSEVCPSDPPLAITRGQVDIVLPFPNSVATLQVNGAELSAMLEHSVSELPLPSGRFFQVSGLCLTVSESATVGNRVTNVVRQAADGSCTGPAVDLTEDETYEIAINDFVAMGGDGYPDYSDRLTTHSPDVQTVSAWLAQLQSPFEPQFQGRIKILP
jgi:hypothetical protein